MPGASTFYKYELVDGVLVQVGSNDDLSGARLSYMGNSYFLGSTSAVFRVYLLVDGMKVEQVKHRFRKNYS